MSARGPAPAELLRALARLGVGEAEVRDWERVPTGCANLTWRVVVSRGDIVAAQVPGGDGRTRGVARETTLALCVAAAGVGVTPDVLLARDGILVQRWVTTVRPFDAALDGDATVAVLRRLHALARALPEASFAGWIERYRLDLRAEGVDPSDVLGRRAAAAVETALVALRSDPRRAVVCHNDLVGENILVTAGRTYLIDFEWVGAAEPLSDVAGLWAASGEDLMLLDSLVDRYLGERVDTERLRARRLALLRHAIDALWYALRGEDAGPSASAAASLVDELPVSRGASP